MTEASPNTTFEPFALSSSDVAQLFGLRHLSSVYRNPTIMAHALRVGPRHWRWRASDVRRIVDTMRESAA